MKPTGAIVCYARSSTLEQRAGLEAQIAQLKAAGATKIFSEHVSSVSPVRPKLAEALAYVREHDVFCVTAADRLARNTIDLLNIVDDLTKRGVTVPFGGDTHARDEWRQAWFGGVGACVSPDRALLPVHHLADLDQGWADDDGEEHWQEEQDHWHRELRRQ